MQNFSTSFKPVILSLLVLFYFNSVKGQASEIILASPDKNLQTTITIKDKIYFSVSYKSQLLIKPSEIALDLANGPKFGDKPGYMVANTSTVNADYSPLYGKRSSIHDQYNQVRLDFKDNYSVVFRAYNEGVAYHFETRLPGKIKVKHEDLQLNFAKDYSLYTGLTKGYNNPYEFLYSHKRVSELTPKNLLLLPFVAEADNGVKVAVTESDVYDYPAFYFKNNGDGTLRSSLPPVPLKVKRGGWMNFTDVVTEEADYIAETEGTRSFPWRIFAVVNKDADLLDLDLVYKLSRPAAAGSDFSWVKPGKVAWDWWNATNLTGVNFRSGVNTETYKYFIDFAAAHNIRYVNLDEGWSDQFDLLKMRPEVNMDEILAHAKKKNVGIILWCVWRTLGDQLEPAMDMFQKWGIAGLKVDFMQRDDQQMVNYYERIAREAAKRKLLVNFHGAHKPTGLNRAYPNVINHEAVRGLEWNKFDTLGTTPEHAVTIPFIRMIAGSMDYTPGAMRNASKGNYKTFFNQPMSQGTRCHQLAMYVVYEAPLAMLSDAPTMYEKEPVILDFLSKVPTTWDDTRALDGKIAEYASIARRKGKEWYVGAMTNWDSRNLMVDLSFLPGGNFPAEIFTDGTNADHDGTDYKKIIRQVNNKTKLDLKLMPAGGAAIHIFPVIKK